MGFDFYGAGNVGDDLMIQGFLDALEDTRQLHLSCSLPKTRVLSQRRRFQRINWYSSSSTERFENFSSNSFWIGVGGTPFQASYGPWLLNRIKSDFDTIPHAKKYMLGVGCEKEVSREKQLAKEIADQLELIWTRDEASRDVLVNMLRVDPSKVRLGSDLANISLATIFSTKNMGLSADRTIGIAYFSRKDRCEDRQAFRRFTDSLPGSIIPVFIANDVREKGQEWETFKAIFGPWRRITRRRPEFIVPDYMAPAVGDLVRHFKRFDAVMANRYHALLTAAWAGCRLAALGRSSKIRFLASELDIPLIESPYTVESLRKGYADAKSVPRGVLESKFAAAQRSVMEFCQAL